MRLFAWNAARFVAFLTSMAAFEAVLFAQSDEIQVYDGSLAPRGVVNLTLHNNFTPRGLKVSGIPGGIIPDKSYNGTAEWAVGLTSWFEAGLYLPVYSVDKELGPKIDGGKLRLLFAVPNADERRFFYGANFEFSLNSKHWDERRFTSEVRPILGWHLKPIDVIFNPIVDTSYRGGVKSLEFAPASRVAYNLNERWAVALEEYSDYGQFRKFNKPSDQAHQLYSVVNHKGKTWEVEAGIGFGLTSASDRITLKLRLARDLRKPKGTP